jgi:hypothetical protein
MSKEDKAKSGSCLQASIDEKPLITQHFFFFTKNPFASKSLYGKFASLKTCAKRKTKRMFLVKVFIEDKKVVGQAGFAPKVQKSGDFRSR